MNEASDGGEAVDERGKSSYLFRPEMVAARRGDWIGEINLAGGRSSAGVLILALVLGAFVLAFLTIATYTRQGTVSGAVVGNDGLPRAWTQLAGESQASAVPLRTEETRIVLDVPPAFVAFAHPGQRVAVRYDAFPYQTVGVQWAVISATYFDSGPAFRIERIDSAPAAKYWVVLVAAPNLYVGRKILPLQPGMRVSATIPMETRSLIRWAFEPLNRVLKSDSP